MLGYRTIMNLKLIFSTILAVFLLVGCQKEAVNKDFNIQPIQAPEVEELKELQDEPDSTTTPEVDQGEILGVELEAKEEDLEIPKGLDYSVAFVSQAPYAVWDDLHKEACEEAAIITIVKYFKEEPLSAHTMEQAILNLVKWEEENNYKIDLTAAEARDILQNYFELKAELVTEVTIKRIKEELAKGKLIIIPAAGRELGNPYFQTPGPIYHMLVIRGYDEQNFITNDVGTKRGDGFKYKYQKLIDAIHDWDHQLAEGGMTDEEMGQGRKVMIVVSN